MTPGEKAQEDRERWIFWLTLPGFLGLIARVVAAVRRGIAAIGAAVVAWFE